MGQGHSRWGSNIEQSYFLNPFSLPKLMKILDVMPGTKDTEIDDMHPKQPVLFLESIFYAP